MSEVHNVVMLSNLSLNLVNLPLEFIFHLRVLLGNCIDAILNKFSHVLNSAHPGLLLVGLVVIISDDVDVDEVWKSPSSSS